MDLREVKQIVEMMKRADLTEFEIEEEGFKLRIARHSDTIITTTTAAPAVPASVASAAASPATPAGAPAPAKEEGLIIKSPMVGTFYRAPSPESPMFVDVGDKVAPDSVVCIIEAMKVMNEIQAEVRGTIAEVLVENAASVEYGQPLFRVKPV